MLGDEDLQLNSPQEQNQDIDNVPDIQIEEFDQNEQRNAQKMRGQGNFAEMNMSAANSDNEDEIIRVNPGNGFNFNNLNQAK